MEVAAVAAKLVDGVQQPALEGGERDEDQIGEGDAGQLHRQLEMGGVGIEAWRHDMQDGGGKDFAEDQEDGQRRQQPGKRILGEAHGGVVPVLGNHAGKAAARRRR